ncbi:hypothetical protein MSG28_013744 [Choristoneura fumiferana]|uniref:Uncharacterized protein n=2 Tax=Choristoneura fumiferana TaxID=7141 RepID=A0ACC0K8P3_CHOFU|nr:hypothetical protein MSG28_013744 [Choristoneura fumiferana]
MSDSDSDIIIASAAFIILSQKLKNKRRKRRWWVTNLMHRRTLDNVGETMTDMRKQEESGQFQNFCRMAPEDFDHLLSLTIEKIRKSSTNFRDSIPAYDKLAVTLRFLATGDSYESLMYFTKMSKSTICNAISEVCAAINEALQNYAKTPSTEEEWLSIAQEFNEKWNFPNCIGAVDGKHCVIQAPINSGSDFFNYKSTFSVVLMAIVDANYNFIFADIGCQGRISDGGVFRNTSFYQKLQNNELNLPNDQSLPGRPQNMPFLYNSPGMMDRIEDDVVIPGQWRNMDRLSSFLPLPNTGRRHTLQCENIRKEFSDYFNLTNILPWQNNIA